MAFFNYNGIKIAGIASAVPTKVVQVDDFIPKFGADVIERYKKMTGIAQLRETHDKQTASDLGCAAAEKLLKEKKIDRNEIGFLFFVSHSFDYMKPATACVLQHRLGLSNECAAMDISLGCSGFVYGLMTACATLKASDQTKALVIVGESSRRIGYPEDRALVMLMGEAGSAMLLEKTEEKTQISGMLCTDGSRFKAIIVPAGGFRNMWASHEPMEWADENVRTLYNANMNGLEVFNFTLAEVPKVIKDFTEKENREVNDYDAVILHQANSYILKQIARKIKASKEKVPTVLDIYGNTSVASIPLTINATYGGTEDRELDLLLCGFGVGLSWGVASVTVNAGDIYPVIETDDYFEDGLINSPEDM